MTKERPIIFSGPMVRAILEGRKTQTRRVIKPQPYFACEKCNKDEELKVILTGSGISFMLGPHMDSRDCPYGLPAVTDEGKFNRDGDHLWVRETWGMSGSERYEYKAFPADGESFRSCSRWRPSIHMPRKACRLVLEIKNIGVERLQDISEEGARAEGFESKKAFHGLWNEINEKRGYSWESNPWAWVIEFEKVNQA